MALIKHDNEKPNELMPVDDIYSRIAKQRENNTETYKDILKVCAQQIYNDASLYYTVFKIPNVYLKCLTYDRDTCTYVVVKNLREYGYYVRIFEQGILFISWHPDHIGYNPTTDSDVPTINEREDGTNVLRI